MSRPVPAEWAPHRAMWLGFPSHEDLWEDNLVPAQDEVEALARALAGPGGERVRLMTGTLEGDAEARRRLGGVAGVDIIAGRFGDVWLRDTGPIFLGPDAAAGFRFNGWGGKYTYSNFQPAVKTLSNSDAPNRSLWQVKFGVKYSF